MNAGHHLKIILAGKFQFGEHLVSLHMGDRIVRRFQCGSAGRCCALRASHQALNAGSQIQRSRQTCDGDHDSILFRRYDSVPTST